MFELIILKLMGCGMVLFVFSIGLSAVLFGAFEVENKIIGNIFVILGVIGMGATGLGLFLGLIFLFIKMVSASSLDGF